MLRKPLHSVVQNEVLTPNNHRPGHLEPQADTPAADVSRVHTCLQELLPLIVTAGGQAMRAATQEVYRGLGGG